MKPSIKVQIKGRESDGFGDVATDNGRTAQVNYFGSPTSTVCVRAPSSSLVRPILPNQARCFRKANGITEYGRVVACRDEQTPIRTYYVLFGGNVELVLLREDEFFVRSNLNAGDPVNVLANLAHETPFFFEPRFAFLRELLRQIHFCRGLPALLSSRIEIMPHQVEIADRVLRDPIIRYLLADEVGLGKTIEAGIVLRQLVIDAPSTRVTVFAPDQLVRQWRDELSQRFDLSNVEVLPHAAFLNERVIKAQRDVVVIDEAHRVITPLLDVGVRIADGAAQVARNSRHLLLLSATPVLHHDSELLRLLELLDPDNYSINQLNSFKKRTALRQDLGRAFLALKNARVRPLIKLNAKKVAELLPHDETVRRLLAEFATPSANFEALGRELHVYLSETYRINRRLLRTRRRWLAETDPHFIRCIEERTELELDEKPHARLWRTLEEWRIETAARVGGTPAVQVFAEDYVALAEVIAVEPSRLAALVETVAGRTNTTTAERALLSQLVEPNIADAITCARADLVVEAIRRHIARFRQGKVVIFCPSSEICRAVASALERRGEHDAFIVADGTLSSGKIGEIFSAFALDATRILLTDTTGEEGFNLQFAQTLVLYDLPWSPMRIEQRLGRLDRVERIGKIICFDVATGEDESLCVDEAWRRVLDEGFGIFTQSISDLQYLVDSEMPRLRECVFLGGPSALIQQIPTLIERVATEREKIEEQDVIDGVHSPLGEASFCRELALGDAADSDFGRTLAVYVRDNIGLRQRWDEENNSFRFTLPAHRDPLIPADRLKLIAQMLDNPATVHRTVAIEAPTIQFLRPGHPAVDACTDLLAWDDRGRAFAIWRAVREVQHPQPIFRCIVQVHVDLCAIEKALAESEWDLLQRGGLLRMVRGWFPTFLIELFVDETGNKPSPRLVQQCQRPYDKAFDRNLSKDRAEFLRSAFGEKTWQTWCRRAADAALQQVRDGKELQTRRESASREANEHFLLLRTRLTARYQAGIDSASQAKGEDRVRETLEGLVKEMISEPVVQLDTIGAYVLSARPFWNET